MIKQKLFAYYCTGFWLEKDENGNEIPDTEIVQVRGVESNETPYYQLRLMGYVEPYGKVHLRQLWQIGLKNRTMFSLINGFSICGRKEQLEYLDAYIKEGLKRTKDKLYNHKYIRIPFRNVFYNFSYVYGKRGIYAYKFDFNFQKWLDFANYVNGANNNLIKDLEQTFIDIRNEPYNVEMREKIKDKNDKAIQFIMEKKLQSDFEKYSKGNEELDIDSAINEFLETMANQESEEINKFNEQTKLDLSEFDDLFK